jgi:aminoglycoside phosphotransferase (APT) family kinase protein
MDNSYLGTLDYADPLYEILLESVSSDVKDPLFHVNRMASRRVYKYTEEKSNISFVGKFFNLHDPKEDRILRIKGEYDNLRKIRGYGFDSLPNYVVRPLNRDDRIGLALTEEFIQGKDLDHYLKTAIYKGNIDSLKDRLYKLATFLYILHSRTKLDESIDLDSVSAYFLRVLNKLLGQAVISVNERSEYLKLMDKWLGRYLMQAVRSVILHGDATPTNFIFTDKGDVVAIDLERMKNGDKIFDVGMVCGELKHAFLWRKGNPYDSEPLIRFFLKSYSIHFNDPRKAFRRITVRNPFYMALAELRIARNEYLGMDYRKKLAHEALKCLKWGLKLK